MAQLLDLFSHHILELINFTPKAQKDELEEEKFVLIKFFFFFF